MARAKLTSLSYLGMAIEATPGTPLAPTGFIALTSFKPGDDPTYIADTGMRGQSFSDFGQYSGVRSSAYSLDGMVFPTSFGNVLSTIFGLDTVTGSSSYTHTFSVASGPSVTLSDYHVAGFRQFAGARCDKLSVKFTPDAGVSYTSDFLGYISATGSAPVSTTFTTTPFFRGWQAAITIDGTANAKLESCTIDMVRDKSKALFASTDSQDPFDIFLGPFAATYSLSFYMEDDTEYAYALTEGVHVIVITFTEATSSDTLTFTSSAVQFTKPTINRGQAYVLVDIQGTAVYNSTDVGVIVPVLVNSVSAAYTTTSAS